MTDILKAAKKLKEENAELERQRKEARQKELTKKTKALKDLRIKLREALETLKPAFRVIEKPIVFEIFKGETLMFRAKVKWIEDWSNKGGDYGTTTEYAGVILSPTEKLKASLGLKKSTSNRLTFKQNLIKLVSKLL